MSNIDQQFVEFVVKSIVNNPDDVSIERTIDEKGVLLMLTVNPEDLGRVIGKRGATAQSLRTLLRALGTKSDARFNLKIVDNGEPRPERVSRVDSAPVRDDRPSRPAADDLNSAPANEPEKVEEVSEVEKVAEVAEPAKEEDSLSTRTMKELDGLDDLEI